MVESEKARAKRKEMEELKAQMFDSDNVALHGVSREFHQRRAAASSRGERLYHNQYDVHRIPLVEPTYDQENKIVENFFREAESVLNRNIPENFNVKYWYMATEGVCTQHLEDWKITITQRDLSIEQVRAWLPQDMDTHIRLIWNDVVILYHHIHDSFREKV